MNTDKSQFPTIPFTPATAGIWFDLPEATYRQAPGVNISNLKAMSMTSMGGTAAHYRAKVTLPPDPPTAAQIFGRLVHSAVLENKTDHFVELPPEFPDFRTKSAQQWRDSQTVPVLSHDSAAAIRGVVTAVWSNGLVRSILSRPGNNEVSGFKFHDSTGLLMKARADRVTESDSGETVIVDLKTCALGEASPEGFSKAIWNWGYHRQAAYYLDVWGASSFVFLAVEKEAPFASAVYVLDSDAVFIGRRDNERDLCTVAECQRSGLWPAYPEHVESILLPHWIMRKELMEA